MWVAGTSPAMTGLWCRMAGNPKFTLAERWEPR